MLGIWLQLFGLFVCLVEVIFHLITFGRISYSCLKKSFGAALRFGRKIPSNLPEPVAETSNFTTSSNISLLVLSPAHLAVPPLAVPFLSFSCTVNYSSMLAGRALPRHWLHRLWMCVQPCDENACTVWFKDGRGSDSLQVWTAVAPHRPISLSGC